MRLEQFARLDVENVAEHIEQLSVKATHLPVAPRQPVKRRGLYAPR